MFQLLKLYFTYINREKREKMTPTLRSLYCYDLYLSSSVMLCFVRLHLLNNQFLEQPGVCLHL